MPVEIDRSGFGFLYPVQTELELEQEGGVSRKSQQEPVSP